MMDRPSDVPIPVHVLTGFLGSGKTTLLNQILKDDAFSNSAVIINEFGEIGLDHHLIETADDAIIELSNGCLCCTVRGQLIETLEDLVTRKPERILIETTGLADPVPVLQALVASPNISDLIEFRGLLTVVDAIAGIDMVAKHAEAMRQVSLADILIVSKCDVLAKQDDLSGLDLLKERLTEINPAAEIYPKDLFFTDLCSRFENTFNLKNLPNIDETHHHHHHDVNRHSNQVISKLLTHDQPMPKFQIEMFLDLLLSAHGNHVLRIKGLANIEGEIAPMVIQGVGRTMSEPYFLKQWPTQNHATNLVVFLDGIDGEFVERLFKGFVNTPSIDTPDKAALTQNPLAIPGYNPKS